MPGGSGEGDYSHFGEFQALIRKWINRDVRRLVTLSLVNEDCIMIRVLSQYYVRVLCMLDLDTSVMLFLVTNNYFCSVSILCRLVSVCQ